MELLVFSLLLCAAWAENKNTTQMANDGGQNQVNSTEASIQIVNDAGQDKVNSTEASTQIVNDDGQNQVNSTEASIQIVNDAGKEVNSTEGSTQIVNDDGQNQVNSTEDSTQMSNDAAQRLSTCWQTFRGRSYIFIKYPLTWAGAQKACLKLDGNLVTIHNDAEEKFVKGVAEGEAAWIGLSDAQEEAAWFWINSDSLTHTNWCPGEPNNAGGPQECALINFTKNKCWDDERCSIRRPFVCEKNTQ